MKIAASRNVVRTLHLLGAAALGTFAYSAWRDIPLFLDAVQWALFPALAASGIWLWWGARWQARRRQAVGVGETARATVLGAGAPR